MVETRQEEQEPVFEELELDKTLPERLLARFRSILVSPVVFFETMPLEGGLKDPVIFMTVVALCDGLGVMLRSLNKPNWFMYAGGEFLMWMLISFVSAAFLMVLARGFGGNGNYEGTYRAVAYAAAPGVIYWIPILSFFAMLYSLYMMRLGLENAHGISKEKAWAVLGIYVLTCIGFAVVVGAMTMAALVGANNAAQDKLLQP
jgi:hypothetical protein